MAETDLTEKKHLVRALRGVLVAIFPEELWDDSVEETARRVIDYWMSVLPLQEEEFKATVFPAAAQQLVVVKDIEFSSVCAHHLLPFFGRVHVGYLPHKLQIGVSKIPRMVQYFAQRPQVQERMTDQISSWMQRTLEPKGSAVVVQAVHTCMACRGVTARNSSMWTSQIRGVFLTAPPARYEFMSIIGNGGHIGGGE